LKVNPISDHPPLSPPPQGMSEAERKLEALTQQIEAEMERKEQEGEYYGESTYSS